MEISSKCINIALDEIDTSINSALKIIGEFVDADRSYIFDYDFEENIGINTFEWCNRDIIPQINELQESPIEAFQSWIPLHKDGKAVVIPEVKDLKINSMKEILSEQGIKSLLTFPLFQENRLTGFTGFDSVRKAHHYNKDEIEIIEIFSKILASLQMRVRQDKERQKIMDEMKTSLEKVKTLSGLLPICAKCKNIRDDKGYWRSIEEYIEAHTEFLFTHGMCKECMEDLYGQSEWYLKNKKNT